MQVLLQVLVSLTQANQRKDFFYENDYIEKIFRKDFFYENDYIEKRNRSGYYGNLGSLKAGTRHHGDYSVMGTPSLQPFLKTYWLTPVNDWPIVAKHANMTSSRGSINAAPATIRQNLNWTPLGWTSSDHGDHRDVSFPLSGNRGYHSNRSVPFQAVTRHHGDYSVMGTLFNPAVREATDSLNQIHSAKAFPPITELEGRAHSW